MSDASPVTIRPAVAADADAIVAMLLAPANVGLVLPRNRDEVLLSIGAFLVAEQAGTIVGCVALRDFGQGLFEVRSLVVVPECMGRGLGSRLVDAAWMQAVAREAVSVFTLTYRPHIFEHLGFKRVKKDMFPQKVWNDCIKCSKRDHCDEIALLRHVGT